MAIQTMLSDSLTITDGKSTLDECCKKLLSNRMILAWIMKCTMREYRYYDIDEIRSRLIEGDPVVAKAFVHQDMAGSVISENNADVSLIHGDNTVEDSVSEGRITYDIRFRAIVPLSGESITLIINVEAQADFWPGYPLIKRGIYYGGRLLSAQYGTEFQKSHYEKLKKVYSIWICTNPPDIRSHSLSKYEITENNVVGTYKEPVSYYDLLTVIMIYLGKTGQGHEREHEYGPEDQIIDLLTVLLSTEMNAEQKKNCLQTEYGIAATEELDKEMNKMCNYSDYVEQIGIQKGMIETCSELGISRDITLSKLISKFSLTPEAAEDLLEKYWKSNAKS